MPLTVRLLTLALSLACLAAAGRSCPEWRRRAADFERQHRPFDPEASPAGRADVERVFGAPDRITRRGAKLTYQLDRCTLHIGLGAGGRFVWAEWTSDPAAATTEAEVRQRIMDLQLEIRSLEHQLTSMQQRPGTTRRRARATIPDAAAAGPNTPVQCSYTTKKGMRCLRPAPPEGRFCWQHQ